MCFCLNQQGCLHCSLISRYYSFTYSSIVAASASLTQNLLAVPTTRKLRKKKKKILHQVRFHNCNSCRFPAEEAGVSKLNALPTKCSPRPREDSRSRETETRRHCCVEATQRGAWTPRRVSRPACESPHVSTALQLFRRCSEVTGEGGRGVGVSRWSVSTFALIISAV